MMTSIEVVFNPTAGQGRAERALPFLVEHLDYYVQKEGRKLEWRRTRSRGDATQISKKAADSGIDMIIAAGGDGTVNEVINGLMLANDKTAKQPALAILPLGCANDFASGLGIESLKDGLNRLSRGTVRRVDIGRISSNRKSTNYFGFSGGIGFVAAVAIERNRIGYIRGSGLYLLAAIFSLKRNRRPVKMSILFDDGELIEQEILLLSVNNSISVGGFPLTPDAQMDDGLLDILYVGGTSLTRMLRLLFEAWRGKHMRFAEFKFKRTQRLIIQSVKPLPVHLDGQIYCECSDQVNRLEIEVKAAALPVVA